MSDIETLLYGLATKIKVIVKPEKGNTLDAADAYLKIAEMRPDLKTRDLAKIIGVSAGSISYLKTVSSATPEERATISEKSMPLKRSYIYVRDRHMEEKTVGDIEGSQGSTQ